MALQSETLNQALGDLRADFRAAKSSRFTPKLTGVNPFGSGADYHYRSELGYLHMIERARDYERNDCIVGSGISRLTASILQDGFSPDPDTGSTELNNALKDKWAAFASEPTLVHSEGEFNFYQLERLALRSVIRDGDCFVLLTRNGTLQFIEGHRPRTPTNTRRNVVHGVLLDDLARRQQVWFAKEDIGVTTTISRVADVQPVDVRDANGHRQVLQLYFPKRLSQRRGITALAPSMDTIGQHDDLQFTTLVKAQMAALLVMVEESTGTTATGAGVTGPGFQGPPTNLAGQVGTSVDVIPQVGAGLHFKTPHGKKLSGFAPNIPNPEFFPHSMLLLTFIAVNLDLPVQVLLLDPSRTNFSSWRGAVDQARTRWREMQADFCNQLHSPVYEFKVRQWIAEDSAIARLAAAVANPLKCKWKKPGWPYIDPYKDAQADALQSEKFLNSMRRLQGKRGQDWDEVAVEIVEDKKILIVEALKAAREINAEYSEAGITWRELLGPGLTVPLQPFAADSNTNNDGEST